MNNEQIIDINAVQSLKSDLEEYSIEVNRQRTIPDVRDGLKPVHKRVLYAMYNDVGAINNTIKSARIIGAVLGSYHPHGDASAYNAMTPLANWFETKIPLIDAQGIFGSIQGDEAAAMRYTGAKLSKYAMDCIIGDLAVDRHVVDWMPNYDNSIVEPEFFPAKVPNLLVNGTFGIGYGIRSEIQPHNLGEVIDATIRLIKDPNAEVVLVPDHCMPVEIVDTNWKAICNKGRGSYTARVIIDIEPGPRGTNYLIIKSTPHLVKLNSVIKSIENLASNNTLQISNMYQESDETQLRYYIQLKRGVDPEYARDVLYKRTDLEKRYTVNFEVLNKLEPVRMSYKSYLQFFIDFRKDTIFRLYTNRLQDANTKYHQADAFIKLLESGEIDNIIDMIRKSNLSNDELVEYLISKINVTDLQAEYILRSNLRNLSLNNLNKYKQRAEEQSNLIKFYKDRILNEEIIEQELIEELLEIKKKYAKPRVSRIISPDEISDIPKGDFRIIITEKNNIKKVHAEAGNGSFRDDRPKFILEGCNTKAILVFNQAGRVYRLPISDIKTSDPATNGTDVRKILKSCTSDIIKVIYEPDVIKINKELDKSYCVIIADDGSLKKIDLSDLLNVARSGLIYMRLDKGVSVKDIKIIKDSKDVVVYDKTKALRIKMTDVPHQRRMTKGMKSLESSVAQGISEISNDSNDGILIITNNGYINRINSTTLPLSSRNKPGTKVINLSKTDSIYSIIGLNNKISKLEVYTSGDRIIEIDVDDIETFSSISKGKRMIGLRRGENIINIEAK